ncbi:MAG: error-prone DNA polymerase, partial [Proteobacteria bacterium]|nr:error-prone DNA polymerase [Pseudomonadota bacterium]
RLDTQDGPGLLCFPRDRAAYGCLARLLTLGRRRAPKGECELRLDDVFGPENGGGARQVFVVLAPEGEVSGQFAEALRAIRECAGPGAPVYLALHRVYRGDDLRRMAELAVVARQCRVPLVATNDVQLHVPARRPLLDVLWCTREHCTVAQAGYRLAANAERHLKPAAEMRRLFPGYEDAVARTVEVANLVGFQLDELRYEYPGDTVPEGATPQSELIRLTWAGATTRYPEGVPEKVRKLIAHELELIGELCYAPYFLTVHDIISFARGQKILCQGRGSAANSAVCYCLGITEVDPERIEVLFERFVSAERGEPPDIDVDFEHERREEVIQYIYGKYGRDRAGLTATVIRYRTRSALREVAKALGLSQDVAGALIGMVWGHDSVRDDDVREAGLDPDDPRLRQALDLARELYGFPRHLSQHVGGFVLTRGPLSEVVPIANAAMEDRTVIEWDKDDLDALGILKVDVLALGMLTCIRKAFGLIEQHHGKAFTLATVPAEDAGVYDMLCNGDSVGVFQVESRAQMSMLPRLKPREFYDLVIEVAIVRPGPIQGDMVHPYLRRRNGEEEVEYPSQELREVLEKTLGVPLFQEQAMRIAIVAAGFTPSEADGLRRAMATFRRSGQIHGFRGKFIDGMVARGYEAEFAERCFRQIEGFGEYGFPESHAASFALLAYVSSWLKFHYPAAFACALLNAQPMGFYAPAQIVRDLKDHGGEVRAVDVNESAWDCTLEATPRGVALRLGFRQVRGLREVDAERLMTARTRPYRDVEDLWRRSRLGPDGLEKLAQADAFGSMGLSRREGLWAVRPLGPAPLPLFARDQEEGGDGDAEPAVTLPVAGIGEEVIEDYRAIRMSLKRHPMALLRPGLARITTAADLEHRAAESWVKVAGLVICRQRPGTASGVVFMTLEDETGVSNLIVWPSVFERYRKVVLGAQVVGVTGKLQREGIVLHVVAAKMFDLSARLGELLPGQPPVRPAAVEGFASRDFH